MGAVNRLTRGLLSLIDTQTQGQNPRTFSDEIRGTLELAPYLYGAKGIDVFTGSEQVITFGAFAFFSIPEGEQWVCLYINSNATSTDTEPTETICLVPYVKQLQQTLVTPLCENNPINFVTGFFGATATRGFKFPGYGIPFQPGTEFGTLVTSVSGTIVNGWAMRTNLFFVRTLI